MRIGIGLTTFNRPECLKECLEHIWKHTFDNNIAGNLLYGTPRWLPKNIDHIIQWHVATDTNEDRRGVAYRKNECLRALKDCDYVFLFDDDCYPKHPRWLEYFIDSGEKHLLYHDFKKHRFDNFSGLTNTFKDCGGVFMFMTKECIDKVGAFNEDFKTYGFEHAEYSQRIYKAGLTPAPYCSLKWTYKYLFAHDYSTPNHKSSITDEEKKECVKNNWNKFFNSGIKSVYLPL